MAIWRRRSMTPDAIETEVRAILARLGMPRPDFRIPRAPGKFGTPHVAGDGPDFTYLHVTGQGIVAREVIDADELLFRLVVTQTRAIAQEAERRTRRVSPPLWRRMWQRLRGGAQPATPQDPGLSRHDDYSRATWMEAHVALLSLERSEWAARVRRDYAAILRKYPLTPEERANRRQLDPADLRADQSDSAP